MFGNVSNDMTIAREEIFGPVRVVLGYESIDPAIEISNARDLDSRLLDPQIAPLRLPNVNYFSLVAWGA